MKSYYYYRFCLVLIMFSIGFISNAQSFINSGVNFGSKFFNLCQLADLDNDGDLDILMGYGSYIDNLSIFRNDGNLVFTEISTGILDIGKPALVDFDNDNDIDFFQGTSIYKNLGNFVFRKIPVPDLDDYVRKTSGFDCADYDNDGDQDLLIGNNEKVLILNNSNGTFVPVDQNISCGKAISDKYPNSIWLDVDNDGSLDIINTKLYRNNKWNEFVWDNNFQINDAGYNIAAGDYNNDGFSDLVYFDNYPGFLKKYDNGNYTAASISGLSYFLGSSFGDFDNDGDLDCCSITAGEDRIYLNNGDNTFTALLCNLSGVSYRGDEARWGDLDNDGDLDPIIIGYGGKNLYLNTGTSLNNSPQKPGNLQTVINGNTVTFSWDKAIDDETPSDGLTYNICIINTSTNDTIKSPLADLSTGKRLIPRTGNVQSNNFWKINGLRAGSYKWTVQAIDHTFQGSLFADFSTFQINDYSNVTPSTNQVIKPDQPGPELTVSESASVISRKWCYSYFPAGPYKVITGETGLKYKPRFKEAGRYFIICKSITGTDTIYSNEIRVDVMAFSETYVTDIPYVSFFKVCDTDNDGDFDFLLTTVSGTYLYINMNGTGTVLNDIRITSGFDHADALWADLNKDNLTDLIISGKNLDTDEITTKILLNQGNNVFSEAVHTLPGMINGSVDAGDFDHDGNIDLLICGDNGSPILKIFRNVKGTFADIEANIVPITEGMAKWYDYDNDDDLDIVMSGTDISGNPFTSLYRNKGEEGFESIDYNFKQFQYSYIDLADYDNDRDIDMLLSGRGPYWYLKPSTFSTVLYKNLGNGVFDEVVVSTDNRYNVVRWFDYNNDNLADILLSGKSGNNIEYDEVATVIHILNNRGNDQFEQIIYKNPASPFSVMADMDNDGDADIIQTNNYRITQYVNNSSIVKNTRQVPSNTSASRIGKEILLSWEMPDESEGITYDLMLGKAPDSSNIVTPASQLNSGLRLIPKSSFYADTGYRISLPDTGKYYWKVQSIDNSFRGSQFSVIDSFHIGEYFIKTPFPFSAVNDSDFDWGDFDNDGDPDLIYCGAYLNENQWAYLNRVYRNDGSGNLALVKDFEPFTFRIKWIDVDNDNDLDIAACYYNAFVIFENEATESFPEKFRFPYRSDYESRDFSICDYNRDGLMDFLIRSNTILLNERGFDFKKIDITNVNYIYRINDSFTDFDKDGDGDFILIGDFDKVSVSSKEENYFRNIPLTTGAFQSYQSNLDIGDLDNDKDPDIIISGITTDNFRKTIILRNDENMQFTELNPLLMGAYDGSVMLGDYDNDNDLDILLSGNSYNLVSKIYENKGNFAFEEMPYNLTGIWKGRSEWADYNLDGNLDIISSGRYDEADIRKTSGYLYKNDLNTPAAPVLAPLELISEQAGYGIKLFWSDNINSGISYNVRIGTVPGKCDVVSPMSDEETGRRKVQRPGNASLNNFFQLDSLPVGTYYWSVQAVNNAFIGSSWAPEQSFKITSVNADFVSNNVCLGTPTLFEDLSVTSDEAISGWTWDFGDGSTSIAKNPSHSYTSAGNFQVKLVATTANYADSIIKTVNVKQKPDADFTALSVCQGIPVTATNLTNNNSLTISSWAWDFDDGSTASVEQPAPHPYLVAADYTVKLKVTASNGCADSVSKVVSVGSYPVAAVTANAPLSFCKGDSVKLSVPSVPAYIYNWRLSGTDITGATKNELVARSSGSYVAEITNPKGNCTSVSPPAAVTVLDAPVAPQILTEGQLVFCQGDSVKLSVAASAGIKYYWKLNGGAVGADLNTYYVKSSGEYSLTLSNPSGCSAGSVNKITVAVNPKPAVPNISKSGVTTFCEGGSVVLSVPEISGNTYSWRNNGEPVQGASSASFTALSTGTYSLNISNSSGCFVRTEPVSVIVKKAPAIPLLDSANFTKGKCPGENPVRLTARNANPEYKYSWLRNGEPMPADTLSALEFYEAGNYMLRATLGGCTAESKVIKADFPEGLAKPVIHAQGPTLWYLACDNTSAARYMWYFNGKLIEGADKYFYVANYKLGKYQVSIANRDGCYTRSDIITIPPGYTGFDDENPFNSIIIYPNPTTGKITIELNNNYTGKLRVEVITPEGKKITSKEYEKTAGHFSGEMDLSGNAKGLYIIFLDFNKYTIERKILIK